MRRFVLVFVLVIASAVCSAARATAPPPSRAELAVYVRGWIDGAAPPGVYVVRASCNAAHVCRVSLSDGSCATAHVAGYAFPGPWHRCTRKHPPKA